jgi:TrmH family RNA methyltransferase
MQRVPNRVVTEKPVFPKAPEAEAEGAERNGFLNGLRAHGRATAVWGAIRLLDHSPIIASTANESVKYARSLHRRSARYRERAFIAEGVRAVEAGIQAGIHPAFLFHTPAVTDLTRARAILSQAEQQGVRIKAVSEPVMTAMADTVTPSGILAVFPMLPASVPSPLTWALLLDGLRDPGNLGTILRSALAARVQLVLTTVGTVDVYSPKVVRAAMGAHFRLNLLVDPPWPEIEEALHGLQVLVAAPRHGTPYWQVDWRQPTALLIGSEAEGVSAQAEQLAAGYAMIPMEEQVESLNAAVAASVLLFEGARQRFYPGRES